MKLYEVNCSGGYYEEEFEYTHIICDTLDRAKEEVRKLLKELENNDKEIDLILVYENELNEECVFNEVYRADRINDTGEWVIFE